VDQGRDQHTGLSRDTRSHPRRGGALYWHLAGPRPDRGAHLRRRPQPVHRAPRYQRIADYVGSGRTAGEVGVAGERIADAAGPGRGHRLVRRCGCGVVGALQHRALRKPDISRPPHPQDRGSVGAAGGQGHPQRVARATRASGRKLSAALRRHLGTALPRTYMTLTQSGGRSFGIKLGPFTHISPVAPP
jgi:hypothetical protein